MVAASVTLAFPGIGTGCAQPGHRTFLPAISSVIFSRWPHAGQGNAIMESSDYR
jgi:hypothetical protein